MRDFLLVSTIGTLINEQSDNLKTCKECEKCQRYGTVEEKMLKPALKINNRSYVNTNRQNRIDEFIIKLSCKDLKTDFSM